MIRLLICVLISLLAHPLMAEDLLRLLGERSQEVQSLQGRFEQQKKIAVLPAPLASHGRFALEQSRERDLKGQGNYIEWELLEPVQQTIRLSPTGITLETAGKTSDALAGRMPGKGAETVTNVFMAIVSGQWETLREYFDIQASGSGDKWHLVLKPRSANLAAYIRQIDIRGGEFTEQLDIAEANGDSTHIRLLIDKVVRHNHGG